MSFFDTIKTAIFGHHAAAPAPARPAAEAPSPAAASAIPMSFQPDPAASTAPVAASVQPVDVDAVLTQKAQAYGKPNNWRTSIVDLLTLLGLDSSLAARKELAQELGVHAGADGSAEQNIALHKAVMQKLAANGGRVPAELLNT